MESAKIFLNIKSPKIHCRQNNCCLENTGWGLQFGWLIHSEEGRMLVARNEEISEWSWAKKNFLYNEKDSPRGEVYLFLYEYCQNSVSLIVEINNHTFFVNPDSDFQGLYSWRKVAFPAGVIYSGTNSIIMHTDIPTFSSWILGIEPLKGKHSFKSWDKGKKWQGERLGYDYSLTGEYLVRIYLKRYKSSGEVISPTFYLSPDWIGKRIFCEADSKTPQGTKVHLFIRTADYRNFSSMKWHMLDKKGEILLQPWSQIKAVLQSTKGENTPRVEKIIISQKTSSSSFSQYHLLPNIPFIFEDLSHPKLSQLRAQLCLDKVVVGSKNELELFIRLRSFIAHQWIHRYKKGGVYGPPCDGLSLLDWVKKNQGHGYSWVNAYCNHFAYLFVQACLSLGYHARFIVICPTKKNSMDGHFVAEVWSNELEKWILMDPDFDVHFEKGKVPLNALDVHNLWDTQQMRQLKIVKGKFYGLNPETKNNWLELQLHNGGYKKFGMLPRNDIYSHPDAFPVEHGYVPFHETHFLWWKCSRIEELPYLLNSSNQASDFYFKLNEVYPVVDQKENRVLLFCNTPGKYKFQSSRDKQNWKNINSTLSIEALGKEPLFIRAVNVQGVRGPVRDLNLGIA